MKSIFETLITIFSGFTDSRHNFFINENFSEKQQSNYSLIVTYTNISSIVLISGFILPLFGVTLWYFTFAILQKLVSNRLTFRCVNCYSLKYTLLNEKNLGAVTLRRTYKCDKCDFVWMHDKQKTGHYSAVAAGGKARAKENAIRDYNKAKEKANDPTKF